MKEQADPLAKIEAFLSDVYEPTLSGWANLHHGADPASGKLIKAAVGWFLILSVIFARKSF
jgi:hypothetical protein